MRVAVVIPVFNEAAAIGRFLAHETAHQWWGHAVVPANAEGATMLVESLTKYSELLVMERRYGRPTVRRPSAVVDQAVVGWRLHDRSGAGVTHLTRRVTCQAEPTAVVAGTGSESVTPGS